MKRKKLHIQFFAEPVPEPAPEPTPEPQPPTGGTMSQLVETYTARIAALEGQLSEKDKAIADRDKTISLILNGKPAPTEPQKDEPMKWNSNFESLLRL